MATFCTRFAFTVLAIVLVTTGTQTIQAQVPPPAKEPVVLLEITICQPTRIKSKVKLMGESTIKLGTLPGATFDVTDAKHEGSSVILATQKLTKGINTPVTLVVPEELELPAETEPAVGSTLIIDKKDKKHFVVLLTYGGKNFEPGKFGKLKPADTIAENLINRENIERTTQAIVGIQTKTDAAIAILNNLDAEFKKFKGEATTAINNSNSIAAQAEAKVISLQGEVNQANGRLTKAEADAAQAMAIANGVDAELAKALNQFAAHNTRITKLENAKPAPTIVTYAVPTPTPAAPAAALPAFYVNTTYCGPEFVQNGWYYRHLGDGKYYRHRKVGE